MEFDGRYQEEIDMLKQMLLGNRELDPAMIAKLTGGGSTGGSSSPSRKATTAVPVTAQPQPPQPSTAQLEALRQEKETEMGVRCQCVRWDSRGMQSVGPGGWWLRVGGASGQ